MRTCKKCGKNFPNRIEIDGRKRNLCKRKYCLECSPFGSHNTRNFSDTNKKHIHKRICSVCGKEFNCANKKGAKCFACYFNEKQKQRSDKAYGIVGESCWFCGYNKGFLGRKVLQFHHMKQEDKLSGLSTREMTGMTWKKVFDEMQKCALLCCRCHAEFHAGLISFKDIEKVYIKKWKEINIRQ